MEHKESIARTFSYFIIICLLCGMIHSNVSGSTMKRSLFSEQLSTYEEISNPSSIGLSSDILKMIEQVNVSILRAYIQKIQEFGPHPTGSKTCEAVEKYLYDTLNSFQLSVRYDPWKYQLRSGKNIVATLKSKESSNIVVVSAHYDSVSVSPGANDDGSGVAIVLAAADIMSHYSFNSTICFVLFSGEEQGLLGSHEYVKNAYRKGERILGDLNLDGVGYAVSSDDGSKIKHHANNQSSWMVDICKAIALKYHDEIGLEVIGLPHVTFSDHESFVKYNFDASYLWAYTRSPFYHNSDDTLEHINMTYLEKVCKLTIGTLASITELCPHLSDSDLEITMKGRLLSYPFQFCVQIENKKSRIDSVNVTVTITMKNLQTAHYVLMRNNTRNITCNWTFTMEIESFWEFKIINQQISNQDISFDVIVKGIKDDVNLYARQHTIGVITAGSLFLFPKC